MSQNMTSGVGTRSVSVLQFQLGRLRTGQRNYATSTDALDAATCKHHGEIFGHCAKNCADREE
jgi:hypothetical protein